MTHIFMICLHKLRTVSFYSLHKGDENLMPDNSWGQNIRDVKADNSDLINTPYARMNSQRDSFQQTSDTSQSTKRFNPCTDTPCCLPPCELFSTAASIALLLYKEMNKCQLETMVNLLTLLVANLAALVTQIDINQGQEINPPF